MSATTPHAVDEELQVPAAPPIGRRIFTNRNLRLDSIKAIGFDMDYTLARYRRERLEALAHQITIKKLVDRGYPAGLMELKYDPSFVIRGLSVDKHNGNIIKLDRHGHVSRVFHGRRELTKKERRDAYRHEKMSFTPPRFALVDTLFSLPEMCLYADVVDHLSNHSEAPIDTWRLFDDIRASIDEAHRDNSLKSVVKADLGHYVEQDPLLARTLHKLRSSGHKIFLLTNSYWEYTNQVMTYLLDGQLAEYPSWRSYFEVVSVGAKKPEFFGGNAPIVRLNEEGQIIERPAKQFERGGIYQGGNLDDFERALRVHGEEILYVGDHIYGDILRSKKSGLWRTALVVEELEDELDRTAELEAEVAQLAELEETRRILDSKSNLMRRRLSAMEKAKGPGVRKTEEYLAERKQRDRLKRQLKNVLSTMDGLQQRVARAFNHNWGMVFKEGNENSKFGEQVAGYACIYTSRASNFFYYSAYQYFRAPRDLMPHEEHFYRQLLPADSDG